VKFPWRWLLLDDGADWLKALAILAAMIAAMRVL
jgi:hypothetical protein